MLPKCPWLNIREKLSLCNLCYDTMHYPKPIPLPVTRKIISNTALKPFHYAIIQQLDTFLNLHCTMSLCACNYMFSLRVNTACTFQGQGVWLCRNQMQSNLFNPWSRCDRLLIIGSLSHLMTKTPYFSHFQQSLYYTGTRKRRGGCIVPYQCVLSNSVPALRDQRIVDTVHVLSRIFHPTCTHQLSHVTTLQCLLKTCSHMTFKLGLMCLCCTSVSCVKAQRWHWGLKLICYWYISEPAREVITSAKGAVCVRASHNHGTCHSNQDSAVT